MHHVNWPNKLSSTSSLKQTHKQPPRNVAKARQPSFSNNNPRARGKNKSQPTEPSSRNIKSNHTPELNSKFMLKLKMQAVISSEKGRRRGRTFIDRKGAEDENEEGESDQEHHRDPLPAQVPADEREELLLLPVTRHAQLRRLPQEDRRGLVLRRAIGQLLQRSITPGAKAERHTSHCTAGSAYRRFISLFASAPNRSLALRFCYPERAFPDRRKRRRRRRRRSSADGGGATRFESKP